MTLNAKMKVFMDFWRFWAAMHISKANWAEITADKPGQPAHEIFDIERSFLVL